MNQLQELMIEIADNMADKLLDKDVQLKGIQAFVSLFTAVPPYKKTLKTKIITKTKGIKRVLRVSYFSPNPMPSFVSLTHYSSYITLHRV